MVKGQNPLFPRSAITASRLSGAGTLALNVEIRYHSFLSKTAKNHQFSLRPP
jgi:hypothetical protein